MTPENAPKSFGTFEKRAPGSRARISSRDPSQDPGSCANGKDLTSYPLGSFGALHSIVVLGSQKRNENYRHPSGDGRLTVLIARHEQDNRELTN